jgi:glutamate-1-semialdehyde aminotransferase
MAAGSAALELLTPTVLADLNELGDVARQRMQAVIHEAGVPWRVTGEASLFRFVPEQRELVGYRSNWADADSARLIERFTGALLNHGVLIDHGGLGCLSTVMSEADVDVLERAVEIALREANVHTLETT